MFEIFPQIHNVISLLIRSIGFCIPLSFLSFKIRSALILGSICFGIFQENLTPINPSNFVFDLFFGTLSGLVFSLPLYSIQLVGLLIDVGRGSHVAQLIHSPYGGRESPCMLLLRQYGFISLLLSGALDRCLINLIFYKGYIEPSYAVTLILHAMVDGFIWFSGFALAFTAVDLFIIFLGKLFPHISLSAEASLFKSSFAVLLIPEVCCSLRELLKL